MARESMHRDSSASERGHDIANALQMTNLVRRKLDVKLLLEADDQLDIGETIPAGNIGLGRCFSYLQVVIAKCFPEHALDSVAHHELSSTSFLE